MSGFIDVIECQKKDARIAELEAENEKLTRLLRDWDALVGRAMEGSRVTGVSPLECLELLARATGLVDAQHRAEQAEAALAETQAVLKAIHDNPLGNVEELQAALAELGAENERLKCCGNCGHDRAVDDCCDDCTANEPCWTARAKEGNRDER